ncbi:ABC-type antimicrobial peptide transport system permease subunit [Microbacterium terrae]|uniref:MacB-like periplasmic core domain protein n=1 Tax=Microbacterium terrae TaxID=69369 RepID=A0A0M2H5T3_9MICO|nr:ABC transporter permease [Microbacterium terrae]KJL39205.1 MacB-like periplasmic core domain protein [Microbacterium terrae]MBP1076861.1 ABC-type antimicrobial peptide transport system permease subunit [Microbacterium terrae]GLJ99456.1 membrane protein [Microbacterium terrae]
MYMTYLRRELAGRKKQTIIVASGLAIAIALVMIVNSLAAGVSSAQAQALESVYGVGTDLTVTGAQAEPGEGGGGQRFEFDEEGGSTGDDGTTSLSQSRLMTEPMRATLDASTLDTVTATDGVAAASGALSLTNSTFSGELPERPDQSTDGGTDQGQQPQQGDAQQGGGGFGGGSFDVDSFTVLGIDASAAAIGPLSAVEVTDGRALETSDAGSYAVVLDATYATTAELAVGDTMDIGGTDFEVVGIVASTSDEADTASNAYIPLDVAQELSGAGDVLSTVYVQAESSDAIASVQEAIEAELPDATVSSQSDLASTVSGSLSSASSLITNLGTWLSVIVLVVALALAVLFTISGVSRRTREFGTLKAIGWSNGRVVGQVAGESVVQSLIGGVIGLIIGFAGILAINIAAPTISTAPTSTEQTGPGGGMMAGGGPGFGDASFAQTSSDIVLQAPVTLWVVAAAIGLAVAGGLLAGAFGGWRAARLSPAEALRSVG